MPKILFLKYWPGTELNETMDLSRNAELAHRRLRDAYWYRNRRLPNHNPTLQVLARATPRSWTVIKRELLTHGWRVRQGRFVNPDAERILRAAKESSQSASSHGRRAARERWDRCPSYARALPVDSPGDARTINDKEVLERVVPLKRSSLNAPKSGAGDSAEQRFLADVARVMDGWRPKEATRELGTWGGWWRNRFREKPDKARMVLADVKVMIDERRIRQSPGAMASDLWKRLP